MKGIVGEVLLEDVHPRVVALWRCAEHIHAGKNATFGFGRVRVDLLSA
jgi:CRISPR/Cas system endoribonuclease Cas6 (RAMP superfamily)